MIVHESLGRDPELPDLPNGYTFMHRRDIAPSQIMGLRLAVNWLPRSLEQWETALGADPIFIGVQAADLSLAAMARVAGTLDRSHGVLADLCVHPFHQGKGIGRVVNGLRLTAADKADIPYLYGNLSPDNPFAKAYQAAGFSVSGAHIFRYRN